jgi:hypothetical protein
VYVIYGTDQPKALILKKNLDTVPSVPLPARTSLVTDTADTALTPAGRMETMRKRLAAVRAATAAIRPALMRFYEALDRGQKVRFAGMS